MKKIIFTLLFCYLTILFAKADEGMWIPLLLEKLNEKEMKAMGMRISAKDIYDINHSSIKDAVVFIGGCTAEVISEEGLIITNHHCGYGKIQKHSTLEHDYLTDGFWAKDKSEELSNPGMIASFLIEIVDVTSQVLSNVTESIPEEERNKYIREQINKIKEKTEKETGYDVSIKAFYYGNQYFMFITETFKDVRLVGAPPSNIGSFGGDTDNWIWPRHTGDFSLFRIYADKNNKPAEYSEDNVPYKSKYHLPISLKGVKEGDFTFVFGYPGRTTEYIPSYEINLETNIIYPIAIKLRTERLNVFNRYIEKNKMVRIQYAAKKAQVANAWKKWIGANLGIKRLNAIEKKQEFEQKFKDWANSLPNNADMYKNLFPTFEKLYQELIPYEKASVLYREAGRGIEIITFASRFENLINSENDSIFQKNIISTRKFVNDFFKDYHMPIDRELFEILLNVYWNDSEDEFLPDFIKTLHAKYKGDARKYTNYVFENSVFSSQERLNNILNNAKFGKLKPITNDPAYKLAESLSSFYKNKLEPNIAKIRNDLFKLQRIYMNAQMEMQPEKLFYPDANSTIRITYGKVKGFSPSDGLNYKHFTTMSGIMEKENPDIYDYVVEDKLKELYRNKDYGQYADEDGSMHVCFLAANHTSGGNSGSPILNADGHLIGINFDRCWESTMSDFVYDLNYCRNISVDIRYCLFIIDKFASATHLVQEMTLIK